MTRRDRSSRPITPPRPATFVACFWRRLSGLPLEGARRKGIVLLAVVASICSSARQASAAPPVCIPRVVGSPGNWSEPPDWAQSGQLEGLRAYTPWDPRWNGAASLNYESASISSDMEFRGLYHETGGVTYLDFSWFIKSAPGISTDPNSGETSLFVGFAQGTSNVDARVIQVKLKAQSTIAANQWVPQFRSSSPTPFEVVIYKWDANAARFLPSNSPLPSWVDTAGVWIRNASQTSPDLSVIGGPDGAAGRNQWVVQLHVPVDSTSVNGVNINPSSFRSWHYVQLFYNVPVTATLTGIVPHTWPRTLDSDPTAFISRFDPGLSMWVFPDPTTWGVFSTSQAGCSGIRITSSDIGTKNPYKQSYIDPLNANCFFAKPADVSASISCAADADCPNGWRCQGSACGTKPCTTNGDCVAGWTCQASVCEPSLTATFRLANWGTQVGDATNASWTGPVQLRARANDGTTCAATTGDEIQGGWNPDSDDDPPLHPAIPAPNPKRWRCMFTGTDSVPRAPGSPGCTGPQGSPTCPNVPGDTGCDPKSAMLHQCMLVELQGANVEFIQKSAIRNMDFVTASRFEREAEVSVKGLAGLAGGKRDVYLYVEALNMPSYDLTFGRLAKLASSTVPRKADPGQVVDLTTARSNGYGIAPGAPMVIVHAYHDTGATVWLESGARPVLLPQTSFAYVVEHNGPIEGWLFSTLGAEPIGGSKIYFKVSVPNDGAVRISNVIEAVEPKRFGLALHGGIAIPHGAFSSTQTLGPAGALEFEYMFSGHWAALVQLGIDDFPGKSGQPRTTAYRLSANAKTYFLDGRFRLFLLVGLGTYRFDSGQTRGGADAGAGVQWLLSHGFALEATYLFHGIANATPTTTYSDVLVGGRFRF